MKRAQAVPLSHENDDVDEGAGRLVVVVAWGFGAKIGRASSGIGWRIE